MCIYNLRISLIISGFRSQEMFVFSVSQKSLSSAFHPVSPALDASLTPGAAPGWHPALQGIILNLKPAFLLLQGFAFPAGQVTQISWDSKASPVPPAALPRPVPEDPGPCRRWWLASTVSCFSSLQGCSICFVLCLEHPLLSPSQCLRMSQVSPHRKSSVARELVPGAQWSCSSPLNFMGSL